MTKDEAFDLKSRLIKAMLPDVPFDGWTLSCLDLAAEKLDIAPLKARSLFQHKPASLIAQHSRMADLAMKEAFESHVQSCDQKNEAQALKITAKIRLAIELRLRDNAQDKEAIGRGLSLLALPQNLPLATKLLYETLDEIWRLAGDTEQGFNKYSKRAILAGVYSSTLLFWLQSQNKVTDGNETDGTKADEIDAEGMEPPLKETLAFLDRRLANVHQTFGTIGKVRSGLRQFLCKMREKDKSTNEAA